MGYYVNPASFYAVNILFLVLCPIAVFLRFTIRHAKKVSYGADDWCALVALFWTLSLSILNIVADALHTFGWHTPFPGSVSDEAANNQLVLFSKLSLAYLPLTALAIGFIRLTFLFMYLRIFGGSRVFKIINWVMIGYVIIWTITFTFGTLFQCGSHFSAIWGTQDQYAEYCPAVFQLTTAMSFTDVFIDVCIAILPMRPVWLLQMSLRKRLLVMAVFALGFFSVAAGIVRLVFLFEALYYDYTSMLPLFGLPGWDTLGITGVDIFWAYIEIGVGCVVAQLPTFPGLFRLVGDSKWYASFSRLVSQTLLSSPGKKAHSRPSQDEEKQVSAGDFAETKNNMHSRSFGSSDL